MPVETRHPEYNHALTKWRLIRAIINNEAQSYIRTIDPSDKQRSEQYRNDAILTNFTKQTCIGCTGLLFRKSPEIALPPEMAYLLADATGSGIKLNQLATHCSNEILQTGRVGLLIDYPKIEDRLSAADVIKNGDMAYIKPYTAESIINWKVRIVNGRCVPYLITLMEKGDESYSDIYQWNQNWRYRTLWLDENNVYEQYTHDCHTNLIDYAIPRKANGDVWHEIPFTFIGAENNDTTVDWIPLYDLALVNLGHYRNSADLEESGFICGQPFIHIDVGDSSPDEFKAANPGGVRFGSRAGIVTSHGSVQLLQANQNQLIAQMMKDKMEQAFSIGARLISPAGGRETAEAARIRAGLQNCSLFSIATNLSWGIERAIQWACQFMGADPSVVRYIINTDFYDEIPDPNLVAQQMMMYDRAIMSAGEIRAYGVKTGFIPASMNEEQDTAALQIDPLNGIDDSIGMVNPTPESDNKNSATSKNMPPEPGDMNGSD